MSGPPASSTTADAPLAAPAKVERVTLVDAIDEAAWTSLLASDPRAHLFQRPAWIRRYARHHRSRPLWLQAHDAAGKLLAGMPVLEVRRRGFKALASGAGGTYGGPVAALADADAEQAVLTAFERAGGPRVLRRELVWAHADPPRGNWPGLSEIEAARIDLTAGFHHFWMESLPKNRRNECNRSERRGLVAQTSRDPTDLEAFAPLYAAAARRWGITPQPTPLLAEIVEQEPEAVLFVARRGCEVLGAHLCFVVGGELFAWLGTTARGSDVFPSTLLIKAEAQFVALRGLRALNLGSSLELQGVADFKRLLGATSTRRWLWAREARVLRLARYVTRRGGGR